MLYVAIYISMVTSVGIGLTNNCNLRCPHCYSRRLKKCNITLPQIETILKKYPKIREINLGTGENILNPHFNPIVRHILSRGISLGLTSNGRTVLRMDQSLLPRLKDVDISLDFASEGAHDTWRGVNGTFREAMEAIEKCKNAGVDTSVALALMSINFRQLADFREILDRFDCCIRINIYKPVNNIDLSLSYDQFWEAMRILADNFSMVSCSEPVLALIIPEMEGHGSPCGNSIRIHPDLTETSCVYLDTSLPKEKFERMKRKLPKDCDPCKVKKKCMPLTTGSRVIQ